MEAIISGINWLDDFIWGMPMIVLLLGSIPLMYFLNAEGYKTLMFTQFGKALLAVCGVVLFISIAAVAKHTRPIEYKR